MDSPDKFWMIVEVSDTEPHYGGLRIPPAKRPGYMHFDKDHAERELLRLQQRYPTGKYILLEAIAEARPKTIYGIHPITDGIPF